MGAEITSAEPARTASFEDCFRAWFGQVARSAGLIARDAALGPDIAQEAFARLYERWDRIESDDHARNFVFRVGTNLARSQLRRRLAAPFGLTRPDDIEASPAAPTEEWLDVADALGGLSPRQRTCVVLVDFADFDAATVGRMLGMAEGTVRVHLSRGRRAVRERLQIEEDV
jgi:RNA polymerase sigma-70 factor (ECF subfamily)